MGFAFTLTFTELRDSLLSLAAVLLAGGVVYRGVVRPVVLFARRLERVVSSVEEQLYPNHGSSLRDAVTGIQKHLGIDVTLPEHNPPEDRRKVTP